MALMILEPEFCPRSSMLQCPHVYFYTCKVLYVLLCSSVGLHLSLLLVNFAVMYYQVTRRQFGILIFSILPSPYHWRIPTMESIKWYISCNLPSLNLSFSSCAWNIWSLCLCGTYFVLYTNRVEAHTYLMVLIDLSHVQRINSGSSNWLFKQQ